MVEQRVEQLHVLRESNDEGGSSLHIDAGDQFSRTACTDQLLEWRFQSLIRNVIEMERRLAHLGDPRPDRTRMLGVEPHVQAESALHLPLRC